MGFEKSCFFVHSFVRNPPVEIAASAVLQEIWQSRAVPYPARCGDDINLGCAFPAARLVLIKNDPSNSGAVRALTLAPAPRTAPLALILGRKYFRRLLRERPGPL